MPPVLPHRRSRSSGSALIATACVALGVFGCRPAFVDPDRVQFGGRQYRVERRVDPRVCPTHPVNELVGPGERLRLPEGAVLVWDFNEDGALDLGVYRKHDHFRDHFGYLTLYLAGTEPLGTLAPLEGKWKEGHWVWLDLSTLPALTHADNALMRWVRDRDDTRSRALGCTTASGAPPL